MPESLIELVYISAARNPFTPPALRELLAGARVNNRRLGVTGLLLHADGSFLQVLEGAPDVVDALYTKIAEDPRHHRILRVFRSERRERSFAAWTMGFVEPSAEARTKLLGFNEFLLGVGSAGLAVASAERVRDLAMQFRMGRWRQHVEAGPPSADSRIASRSFPRVRV